MGHVGDEDGGRLRRELIEETLEECERLLEAAHAAAAEIRLVAQRHALERGDAAAHALTVAAQRLQQEAASDRQAAREARELAGRELQDATRMRAEIDRELHAATAALDVARHEALRLMADAEAHLRDAAAAGASVLSQAHETAAALQIELLEELDEEVAARLAQLDEEVAARGEAAARDHDERLRAAAAEVRRAELAAAERLALADRAADERLAQADQQADELLRAAEREAATQLHRSGAETGQPLDTAYQEARRIIAAAEAEAEAIRSAADPANRLADGEPNEGSTPPRAPAPGQRRRRRRWVRNVRMLVLVLLALAGTELLRTHVAQPYTVAKTSMEPHLHEGDRLFVNKLAFRAGDPSRGDVVVFDSTVAPSSADGPGTILVKRVIGLPGEVIQSLDGHVVIDGEVIADPWSEGKPTAAFGPTRVPEGMIFVLGDNRGLSVDSRTFGSVPIDSVIGRVEAVIWPAPRVGRV